MSDVAFYRVYRGAGSPDAIDYAAPVATVAADGQPIRLADVAGGWPAGDVWFIAVRSVDADGVEFAQPAAVIRAEFTDDGERLPRRPAPPVALTAASASGSRIALAWRYRGDSDQPSPARFEIFIAPTPSQLETMLDQPPTATVSVAGRSAGDYAWTSGPLPPGPHRAAVRAVAADNVASEPALADADAVAPQAPAVPLLHAEVR